VKWIETYIGEDYAEAERVGSGLLERGAVGLSRAGLEEAVEVFVGATKVSLMRWHGEGRRGEERGCDVMFRECEVTFWMCVANMSFIDGDRLLEYGHYFVMIEGCA